MNSLAPSLGELQAAFQSYVLRNTGQYPATVVTAVGATVYAEAYRLRLLEALQTDYPTLQALLGDSRFAELAHDYISASPSHHYSIRWFGRHLPEFLGKTPPYSSELCLAELATLEWTLSEAFDAASATPLDAAALRAISPQDWPELTLGFHPSLRRLDLQFSVVEWWKAQTSSAQVSGVPLSGEIRAWLIWRRDLEVLYRPMAAAEDVALDALRGGASFADTAAQLVAEAGIPAADAPAMLATWLHSWVGQGLIVGTRQ